MAVESSDVPALVGLAERLRRETYGCKTWDRHGAEVIFARELIGMNFRIALEQVIAHACDPEAKTPAAITRPFKPEPADPPRRSGAPRREQECEQHPGQFADNCGGCRADILAGDTSPVSEQRRPSPGNAKAGAAAARAAAGFKRNRTEEAS